VEDQQAGTNRPTNEVNLAGRLWPSPAYTRQIEALNTAIGEKIFLVELKPGDVNLGIRISDTPYELLGVVSFPKPDPESGLFPHLILLDDGRGINLGRIARITVNAPFSPAKTDILYQDGFLMESLLLRNRRLSKASIAARSKALLGRILGKPALKQINQSNPAAHSSVGTPTDDKRLKQSVQKTRSSK